VMDGIDRDTDRFDGFEKAYVTYRGVIYGHVLKMMLNEPDAEDLTVTAFEKAMKAWERRPPEDELRPWLFRIATNACLDELRRRQRIQWRPWDLFASVFHPSQIAPDDPEREVLRGEQANLVHEALSKLAPRDRAALIMRECYGLSNEEVGKVLNLSRDGAKMMLFRARERLRAAYLQLGGEPQGSRGQHGNGPRHGRSRRAPVETDPSMGVPQ
jgi:RNA polymerase sigma-70 factor, ECF subfamily